MKKILIISAVFPPEQVVSAKLSFDIADKLSGRNLVTVISPKPSRPHGFQFNSQTSFLKFNHIQINSYICASSNILGRLKESYSFGIHSFRYIKENHQNIDIIYANTWPLLSQYYIIKAKLKYNIPIVLHIQDIYPESLCKKFKYLSSLIYYMFLPLDKYILRNANQIITISKRMKDHLARTRKLEAEKLVVVQNWQDEEAFINYSKELDQGKANPFTFMYLGNIGPVAGVDLLLKAFSIANLKKCRLIIAGSGSMKQSLIKQARYYTESTIEFWHVPEGKVAEVQSSADVLILPIMKGFASSSIPSKLSAYMFSAKPIIACVDKNSDTATAIKNANCGWVIKPEDTKELAELMVEIVAHNNTEIKSFGRNGRNYALANYSKKHNLPRLVSIISEVIST